MFFGSDRKNKRAVFGYLRADERDGPLLIELVPVIAKAPDTRFHSPSGAGDGGSSSTISAMAEPPDEWLIGREQ